MIPKIALDEKRVYLTAHWALVLISIFIAIAPIPTGLIALIKSQASHWQNLQYLRMAILLAGIGIAVQMIINRNRDLYYKISLAHHILITILIVYVSVAVIILWKFIFGIIPDLEVGQGIYLFTVLSDSTIDLFQIRNISEPPFLAPPYGPFYFATAKLLMRFLGESIFVLRFITLVSLLAICGALKLIAQKYSNSAWRSWATPAIFLAAFPLVTWSGPPIKPEYFAAFLSVYGVLSYVRLGFNGSRWWILISGIFFVLAIFVKFTILVGLLATLAHLLVRRKFREFLGLFSLTFGSILFLGILLNTLTQGGFLIYYFLGNSAHLQIWKIITVGFLGYLGNTFTIIASAAVITLITLDKTAKNLSGFIGIAFFAALSLFILSLGRDGSSANYFLEGVVFGSIAIGLLIASPAENTIGRGFVWVVVFYLLLMLPTRAALIAQSYGDPNQEETIVEQIGALDTQEDEYILSTLQYAYAIYQAEKKPLLIDNLHYTLLSENDMADSSMLYAYLENGQVPYLVLHAPLDELSSGGFDFPKEITDYLLQNYECETVMKRWDGSLFVLCGRNSSEP